MPEGLDRLVRQLRAEPSPAIAALTESQLDHLAGALQGARARQAQELSAASHQALEHIPRLLRGPVRKIVGSG